MAVQTDAYLKGRFITGAKPTETDFADLIDSKARITHTHAIADVTGLQAALDAASGGATAWGDITGTLSNQTDLNNALSGKSDTSHTHTAATTSAAGFMSSADKTKLNALNTTLQVPSGGTAGQFVRKGASAPEWADVIQVPTGGTDGQVLSKVSGSVAWADAGGGGVWTEIDAGALAANTDLTFTGLDSSRTLYRMIVVPQTTGSGINVTKAKINDTQHTSYSINTNGSATSSSSQDGISGGASTWDITIAKSYSQHHILPDQRHLYYGGQYQRWAESSQSSMSSIVWRFNVAVYYKFLKLEL